MKDTNESLGILIPQLMLLFEDIFRKKSNETRTTEWIRLGPKGKKSSCFIRFIVICTYILVSNSRFDED